MSAFVSRMAWRETRAAWRHFAYFFVCIALGVAALVGVDLFAANLERAIQREARSLMAADVELRTTRPLTSEAEDRKSTRLNSSHGYISYAVFCLKKKKRITMRQHSISRRERWRDRDPI